MMGRHHAMFGGSAFLAASMTLTASGQIHLSAEQVAVGTVVAMGAALVPDLDEPGSSASRSFGLLGRYGAKLVAKVTGGHRGGTHTLPVWAAAVAATFLATASPLAAAILLGLLVTVGLDVLRKVPEGAEWLAGGAVFLLASQLVHAGDVWPALAVGVGWLSHMAGDTLTPHGVPWLWPSRPLEDTVSVGLFRSGSSVESVVSWVLIAGLLWWAVMVA